MDPLNGEPGSSNGHGPPIEEKMFDTITGAKITSSNHAREIIDLVKILCNLGEPDDPSRDHTFLYRTETLVELRKIREDFPEQYYGYFQVHVRDYMKTIFWPDLDKQIASALLPSEIPITLPHRPDTIMPPLPSGAQLDPALASMTGQWLDDYVAYSQIWSSRGAEGFHEAVGIWMLSSMAARRIFVNVGKAVYPSLFLALVAPSSIYAKTTTADLGRSGLEESGGQALLAADRTTPQAFLRSMSGRVPPEYSTADVNQQDVIRAKLAFAGQRAWFFDEWGGMLKQMVRNESPLAAFHELLRVLDDSRKSFSSETIQRGLEFVDSPYLALLTCATPHDLEPFMRPGHSFWHDGFWPRFAVIVPGPEEVPSLSHRPPGLAELPRPLQSALVNWHVRLGIPEAHLEAVLDAKGKDTGVLRRKPLILPRHELRMDPDTFDAYNTYGDALYLMAVDRVINEDLSACYVRFQEKALRIALLLASFEDAPSIELKHWARAQQITEKWRAMLHHTVEWVMGSRPMSKEQQLEDRIVRLLERDGPNSARYCQRHIKGSTSGDITKMLKDMVSSGRVMTIERGKGWVYALVPEVEIFDLEDPVAEAPTSDGIQDEVPF